MTCPNCERRRARWIVVVPFLCVLAASGVAVLVGMGIHRWQRWVYR